MHSSTPKALLFDLGGVLVDIDFSRALTVWANSGRDWRGLIEAIDE